MKLLNMDAIRMILNKLAGLHIDRWPSESLTSRIFVRGKDTVANSNSKETAV